MGQLQLHLNLEVISTEVLFVKTVVKTIDCPFPQTRWFADINLNCPSTCLGVQSHLKHNFLPQNLPTASAGGPWATQRLTGCSRRKPKENLQNPKQKNHYSFLLILFTTHTSVGRPDTTHQEHSTALRPPFHSQEGDYPGPEDFTGLPRGAHTPCLTAPQGEETVEGFHSSVSGHFVTLLQITRQTI